MWTPRADAGTTSGKAKPGSAEERAARKTLARLDKQLKRLAAEEATLTTALAEASATPDVPRLEELGGRLKTLRSEREAFELEWLEASDLVD